MEIFRLAKNTTLITEHLMIEIITMGVCHDLIKFVICGVI